MWPCCMRLGCGVQVCRWQSCSVALDATRGTWKREALDAEVWRTLAAIIENYSKGLPFHPLSCARSNSHTRLGKGKVPFLFYILSLSGCQIVAFHKPPHKTHCWKHWNLTVGFLKIVAKLLNAPQYQKHNFHAWVVWCTEPRVGFWEIFQSEQQIGDSQ